MAKRKAISSSLRWSVFARDGFTCRYCGARAGQDGVELHADHVVSVADGGDNSYDNLVAACNKCNGGKSARSLDSIPASKDAIDRLVDNARSLEEQTAAINKVLKAEKKLRIAAENIKREAYGDSMVRFQLHEVSTIVKWIRLHGPNNVLEWYSVAARNGVRDFDSVRYVGGIVRNKLELKDRDESFSTEIELIVPVLEREISFEINGNGYRSTAKSAGIAILDGIYRWLSRCAEKPTPTICASVLIGFINSALKSDESTLEASNNA